MSRSERQMLSLLGKKPEPLEEPEWDRYNSLVDYIRMSPAQIKQFYRNYQKLNKNYQVLKDKKTGDIYGFEKGSKTSHWRWDAEDERINFAARRENIIKLYKGKKDFES